MNHSPESTETPVPPDEAPPIADDESLEIAPPTSTTGYEDPSPAPWWKISRKALLGLGVFVGLATAILATISLFKMDMGGMEGHNMGGMDMEGMSMDDMMGVDGAFNAIWPASMPMVSNRLTTSSTAA